MRLKKLIKALKAWVEAAPTPDPDGMTALIEGSAGAIGENTLATGTVLATMVDHATYTIGKGSAKVLAAASGKPGNVGAFADTDVHVEGADFVVTFERSVAKVGRGGVMVESTMKYVAIDFDGWAPAGGQMVVSMAATKLMGWPGGFGPKKGWGPDLTGNLATIEAGALSVGGDSIAATLTHSTVVEGHASIVDAAALTGVA